MLRILFGFILLWSCSLLNNPSVPVVVGASPAELENRWVDSVLQTLSFDERIGQLMMIRAHSDKGPEHVAAVKKLITEYAVGGACFFQGTPLKQAELTNEYQAMSRVPMLIAQDAEWGLNMRLKSVAPMPYQLTMGAVQNDSLVYAAGAAIGRQCRRLGVHVNFAPVADVNNNPNNPVINFRSFGESPQNVARKASMYALGMQAEGVLACAKHFPGHGDTDLDSHYDLPKITHARQRLDAVELVPFREMIDRGVGSFMVAHLEVPALEQQPHVPTTLSRNTVTNLLRQELGFTGLIFTDGLEMKGVTKHYGNGEVEARALAAGNDVLLLPESVPAAFTAIKRDLQNGKLDSARINESCRRVLVAKYRAGLADYRPVETFRLAPALTPPAFYALQEQLFAEAMTLVRNDGRKLPLAVNSPERVATVLIGSNGENDFAQRINAFKPTKNYYLDAQTSGTRYAKLINELDNFDRVIVGLHNLKKYPSGRFGLSTATLQFLDRLTDVTEVSLVLFGNPYALQYLPRAEQLLVAHEDQPIVHRLAAEALFGARSVTGRLPVRVSDRYPLDAGFTVAGQEHLLHRTTPELAGLSSDTLFQIDTIVWNAIRNGSTPGAVVLVAKGNKIVYHKAFGYHTYAQERATRTDDIFDLASITKIGATTLGIMDLTARGKFHPEHKLSTYLPILRGTNKENLTGTQVLTHSGQLKPWIPFYKSTILEQNGKKIPNKRWYAQRATSKYSVPVTRSLYLNPVFQDSIWSAIVEAPMLEREGYRYSDLGFYLLGRIIKEQNQQHMDTYLREAFYQKMGLHTLGFNPLDRFPADRIPPTEEDQYFRMGRLQGNVHDMGAALFGGVAGNAGLFGNAEDLAKLMHVFLNQGRYGDTSIIDAATLAYFQHRPAGSTRRGLGFDMKELDPERSLNIAPSASDRAFGHYGFTGTAAWADPENDLIVIFLSNRTYPTMRNNQLNKTDVRSRVQEVAYRAVLPTD